MSNYRAGAMVGDQGYPAWELAQVLGAVRRLFGEACYREICEHLGVAPEVLAHMTLVPVWQVAGAMEALCSFSDDCQIGMRAAADYKVAELGFLKGYLARCETLGDCFGLLNDNPEWEGSMSDSLVSVTSSALSVRWINTLRLPNSLFQCHFLHSLGALVVLGRALCGERFSLDSVALACPPHEADFISSLCGVTPEFNAPFYEWRVATDTLALPVRYTFSDEERKEPCLPQPSFIDGVLEQLKSQMPLLPTLTDMAQALGMSERTLRRKLADNGCSYQRLLDQVRSQAAISLILQANLSADDIAERLGFTDVSHFRASFKHWLGAPPGKFQRLIGSSQGQGTSNQSSD